MLPRLQIDTLVACFLLKYFGEKEFPDIDNADYLFWIDIPEGASAEQLEKQGHVFLDMGGGRFDHHVKRSSVVEKCVSQMVAEYLGIHQKMSVKKLLEYARRDDIEGRGTLSKDPIDRAFGLSGLVNNLNRMFPEEQKTVLHAVMPLFLAHYIEEKKRHEDFPAEYEKKIREGKASIAVISTAGGSARIIAIETDEVGMAGYLRARNEIAADIVVQKMSSGHINIVTQQKKMLELGKIAAILRREEMQMKGVPHSKSPQELAQPGRIEGAEEWYLDTRARTIQNGGIHPQWTTPTRLSLERVGEIIKEGLM